MYNKHPIRKSSSLANINHLSFNPSQFQVGSSRIDTLPIIHAKSINKLDEDTIIEINELRKKNNKLYHQNIQLKNKLSIYLNNEINKIKKNTSNQQSNDTSHDYKTTFINKINKSKCNTLCQTLFSSKLSINQHNISEIYDHWRVKNIQPDGDKLLSVAKKYLDEFQDNFLKLKLMIQSLQGNSYHLKQLENYLTLFKVPIVFKNNPLLLAKSVSKSNDKKKEHSKDTTFQPQTKSFQQTVALLETIVKKIVKSDKMLDLLKNNNIIQNFTKKLKSHN